MPADITGTAAQRCARVRRLSAVNAESAELISGPARAPATRDASVAVTALFRTHHLELVRLARLMVGDLATAEDIVQDAFEQLHRRWGRLRDQASILAYARSSVLNGCRTVHRRGAVARRYSPVLAARETQADATAAAAEHEAMMAALRALPRRQREVLVLRYYADLDVAEISGTLGISPSAVRSTATRGLAALARAIRED
jgi:RNA polymerase sigma-70 factor (sigma-E family)